MSEAENNLTPDPNQAIDSTVASGVEVERFENGKPLPAPGADEQKPKEAADAPATDADDKKSEQESPEKQQERELSRRQRARLRDAKALGRAEAERDAARAELAKRDSESAKSQEPAEPKREDFQDYESYLRAVAKFDAEQATDKRLKADREAKQGQEREQQQQPTKAQQEQAQAWTKREAAYRAHLKDYDDTVTPKAIARLGLSDEARRAIVESESGPGLLHHLVKNPAEAWRIADLSEDDQADAIEELEEKLPKPGKKASNAPAPPNPPKGGHSEDGFSETMSQKDYEKKRAAQGSPWAPRA